MKKVTSANANTLADSQQSGTSSNNARGEWRQRRAKPQATSLLPNNNKKHLCEIDQAVRGRWRARQGQIGRNPLWSPSSFTKSRCGVTGTSDGRQMVPRDEKKCRRMCQNEGMTPGTKGSCRSLWETARWPLEIQSCTAGWAHRTLVSERWAVGGGLS